MNYNDFYLFVLDFDGTAGNTFAKSPNDIGVNEAYRMALFELFEYPGKLLFNRIGLNNMAPSEIISQLLKKGNRDELIKSAHKCFCRYESKLGSFMLKDKGSSLIWDHNNPEKVITEMLVHFKLSFLLDEIGSDWPLPCNGFLDFLKAIKNLKKLGLNIQIACLSSGHDLFIRKTFNVWGEDCPDILLTDDNIRGMFDVPIFKPDPLLMDLVQKLWMQLLKISDGGSVGHDYLRNRMIYFGDDSKKDGKLAEASGIPFGWFNPSQASISIKSPFFSFSDWREIAAFFMLPDTQKSFMDNLFFKEILAPLF